MTNFAVDIRQWVSVEAFEAHLAAHSPTIAPWAKGVVMHHTYRPVQSQWNGRKTLEGIQQYYQSLGWDAGPHLFVVTGSPNRENDGIWQLTPLNMVGIHAGVCNSSMWGIEVVGDYDKEPWSPDTKDMVVGATAALMRWRSLSVLPSTLKGHRDCNSPKTCPGKMVDMNQVRDWVSQALLPHPAPEPNQITAHSSLIAPPRITAGKAVEYILGRKPTPQYTRYDIETWIVPTYFKTGEFSGIDPCLAIAQMIHETGNLSSWWAERPRRNPAGIGVTGESRFDRPHPEEAKQWAYNPATNRWQKGLSFSSWQIGVLVHVGRLAAYATKPVERTEEQQEIISLALRYRPLPLHLQGSAPTLIGLNGTWAYPGRTYAQTIAAIANAMQLS